MAAHPLIAVLNSSPINRQARQVTPQARCAAVDADLSRDELLEVQTRLVRKHRLMKSMLQISTPAQHKNAIYRHNKGIRSNFRPRRLMAEYVRVGAAMLLISQRLHEIGRVASAWRRELGAIENQWKAEHPGAIWDGRQLIAPSGAVFFRSAVAQGMHR